MRCHEVRQRIGFYLDSELDVETCLRVKQHLETCPDCARALEAEARLEHHLGAMLNRGERTPSLWKEAEDRVRAPLAATTQPRQPGRDRIAVPMPAIRWTWKGQPAWALAFATAVVLMVWFAWPRKPAMDLAVVSAEHHQEYLDHRIEAEFAGAMPEEFARKLQGEIDPLAFFYSPAKGPYQPRGARLCHLQGVPAAMIFGACRQTPISMLVFKKSDLAHFPMARKKLESGEAVVCDRVGRHCFAVRTLGQHVICLIADLSHSEVEDFLKSVAPSA